MQVNELVVQSGPSAAKSSGLEGVVVADTRLSQVDGERGELVIAGSRVDDLAGHASFEAVAAKLLGEARYPLDGPLSTLLGRARVAAFVRLADRALGVAAINPMSALMALLAGFGDALDVVGVLGAMPVLVAAHARAHAGLSAIAPHAELGHAADFLSMLGIADSGPRARALDAYLVTVCDHGLNASTFTARVVASTASDTVSSLVAAVGALKGPLHGGAPGPVLDMLDGAARAASPRAWLEAELAAGRRIMGMGHRVYRVRDPRAAVLERAVERLDSELAANGGHDAERTRLRLGQARNMERAAEALLAERHPERKLRANVEFYTAILLEAVGIPRELFSAVFAVGRSAGWLAHVEEQRRTGRLIRPQSRYVGA
ncbi:MAG TPA: citrate synthase [Polyangiaceae bacterium]|jgi:citrate synthase